jgi:hypothetical protein
MSTQSQSKENKAPKEAAVKKSATLASKNRAWDGNAVGNSGEAKQLYEKAKRALKDSKTKQNEGVIQEAFKNLSEACNKDS